MVEAVRPYSAAEKAGIKPGDQLLQVNDKNTALLSFDAVLDLLQTRHGVLKIKVLRDNKKLDFEFKIKDQL